MSDAIVFENFSVELSGRNCLDDLAFSVSSGEVAAIFGGTGSGKTCIVDALIGRIAGSSGRIRILGRDVSQTFKTHLNRPISVGFQSLSFAPELTVQENLELQSAAWRVPRNKRAGRIMSLTQLLGLERLRRVRAGRLSLGEKRMLEAARAMLPESQVVVFDGLLDDMDPHIRNKVFRHLFDAARKEGATFIITTSNPDVAELCDKIILLHQGRILAVDSPEELHSAAPDEMLLVQSEDNPLLRRRISERFQVIVRESSDGLVFSVPKGDLAAAEILSELEAQVACVRVRRRTLYEIIDSLAAQAKERSRP